MKAHPAGVRADWQAERVALVGAKAARPDQVPVAVGGKPQLVVAKVVAPLDVKPDSAGAKVVGPGGGRVAVARRV